jgi:L-fuconolactonase
LLPIRPDWLELTKEKIIDPEIPICDPHHHLWYDTEIQYTIKDLMQDIDGGHNITKTVFVESQLMLDKSITIEMQPVGETA